LPTDAGCRVGGESFGNPFDGLDRPGDDAACCPPPTSANHPKGKFHMLQNPIVTETARELERKMISGAHWFYWIAALSLINSIIAATGSQTSFALGLGITLVMDAVVQNVGGSAAKVVGLAFDVAAVGVTAMFGFFAAKKHTWAFIVGMILYTLDGLIYVAAGEIIGILIHAWALVAMFLGMRAAMKLNSLEKAVPNPHGQPGYGYPPAQPDVYTQPQYGQAPPPPEN
jgi:hypothetical protein